MQDNLQAKIINFGKPKNRKITTVNIYDDTLKQINTFLDKSDYKISKPDFIQLILNEVLSTRK
tara:strand:- start:28 stop:216 length:189 start_codon:yes stop_codon:yes gene_type:complete